MSYIQLDKNLICVCRWDKQRRFTYLINVSLCVPFRLQHNIKKIRQKNKVYCGGIYKMLPSYKWMEIWFIN